MCNCVYSKDDGGDDDFGQGDALHLPLIACFDYPVGEEAVKMVNMTVALWQSQLIGPPSTEKALLEW